MFARVPDKIDTERLVLRKHQIEDIDGFAAFLAHPTATQYMAFTPEQKTRGGAREMLEYAIASYTSDNPIFSLTIADPNSNAYLGACGLNPLADDDGVEIYYTVLPEHQNKGWATEAVKALIDFVWNCTDIQKISAYIVSKNIASIRVADKLGFVDTGPVEREATTGELAHEALVGRRYVLSRSK